MELENNYVENNDSKSCRTFMELNGLVQVHELFQWNLMDKCAHFNYILKAYIDFWLFDAHTSGI